VKPDPLEHDASPVFEGGAEVQPPASASERRLAAMLWPSFLMAGVVEMLVFSMVDPADLRWMGSPVASADPMTVYSVAFLLFWAVIALASAMTQMVMSTPTEREDRLNRSPR
jgi:hypothetical protein